MNVGGAGWWSVRVWRWSLGLVGGGMAMQMLHYVVQRQEGAAPWPAKRRI
jgi:hypothetical protein